MSTVYDEALLDAKKIRESAELAAREKIMETITPQIREMINQRILFEQDIAYEEDVEAIDGDVDLDSLIDALPAVDLADENAALEAAAENPAPAVAVYATGDVVNVDVSSEEEAEEDLVLDQAVTEAFAKLVKNDFVVDKKNQKRVDELCKRVEKLSSVLNIVQENKLSQEQRHRMELSFMACIKEAVELSAVIDQGGRGSQRLKERLNSTIKEMREMSSKYKKNIFDFLFEAEDAEMKKEGMYEQDEVEAEETVEVDEELEVEESPIEDVIPVADAEAALEDLGAALGLEVSVESEVDEEVEVEDEEVEEEGLELEEVYEIDESVLRRELSKMRRARRLREQEEATLEVYTDPAPAESLGDVLELDEDDLLNALADELGTVSDSEVTVETRRRPQRRSANRAAQKAIREAAEYKKAATHLKKQLVEMNLFNAKLLYANKLLQNKNLTVKQQRAIVEALDNAKTLREAKLLYKSLSGSLARRGQGGKNLSESVRRTLGSSSRSTRSAQPAKSGVETDRWAVLAGISKN